MARRRRGAPTEGEAAVADPTPEGPGARLDVRMSGTAEQVRKQLGVSSAEKPDKERPEGNGHDEEKAKFVEALRNSKYIIRVKRLTPREFNNVKTNVEVWTAELPLAYNEIQEEVKKDCGGGKYRVAIVDPNSNSTICADVFEVDGDPIVEESAMAQEEQDRIFMNTKPKTAAEMTEDGLERAARVTSKQIEVETLQQTLNELRSKAPGKPGDKKDDSSTKIEDLERRMRDAQHAAELESRDRKHAEEMKELKALIAQNAKPQKADEGSNVMTMLLEQMKEDRRASQAQFTALLTQMKDDKMNAVLEEVKSLRNKPQQQTPMLEMAQTMIQMKKLLGWEGAGGNEDDEDDDKDDDRPWWEKALDKLGGKLGDKLWDKFTSMEEKGEKVDREKFLAELNQYTDKTVEDAIAKAQADRAARVAPAVAPQAIPAKPAIAAPPPPAASPVAALPPPPPEVAAPSQAPSAPVTSRMTVEQEVLIRVGGVLEMIEREIQLRPNEYQWNYEGAFLALPEEILEKVCAAPDPVSMFDAFAINGIVPEMLTEMKKKVSDNPRIVAWLKIGHDDLKAWWAEKLKDPKFDPFADEGEEVEE